jgi:hypothetical protein
MVVSFSRKILNQTGDGHYSPIGNLFSQINQKEDIIKKKIWF